MGVRGTRCDTHDMLSCVCYLVQTQNNGVNWVDMAD